jgi:hypothetical protein
MQFIGNGLTSGLPVPGFCTTMRHATRPWVSGNTWPSTSSPWFPTHLTHQIWPPMTSSSSPGWRAPWRGNNFKTCGDTTKYNTAVAGHSQTSLPDMHWKVEGLLESLNTIWRIVLWRRQLWVTCRCFNFPTINSVLDIFVQPSYMYFISWWKVGKQVN